MKVKVTEKLVKKESAHRLRSCPPGLWKDRWNQLFLVVDSVLPKKRCVVPVFNNQLGVVWWDKTGYVDRPVWKSTAVLTISN